MRGLIECLALVLLKSEGTNIGILALLKTYIDSKVLLQYQIEIEFITNWKYSVFLLYTLKEKGSK
jgi:hypothetical protein